MKTCLECGVPMKKAADFADGDVSRDVCGECATQKALQCELAEDDRPTLLPSLGGKSGMIVVEADDLLRRWHDEPREP